MLGKLSLFTECAPFAATSLSVYDFLANSSSSDVSGMLLAKMLIGSGINMLDERYAVSPYQISDVSFVGSSLRPVAEVLLRSLWRTLRKVQEPARNLRLRPGIGDAVLFSRI